MNTSVHAQSAYSDPKHAIRTERGVEYHAFARITHRLHAAFQDPKVSFARRAEALHENRRLWIILAADVAREGNELPERLRAQIFYLAEFSFEHSRKVLDGAADPDILIEINTSVMKGLRGGAIDVI